MSFSFWASAQYFARKSASVETLDDPSARNSVSMSACMGLAFDRRTIACRKLIGAPRSFAANACVTAWLTPAKQFTSAAEKFAALTLLSVAFLRIRRVHSEGRKRNDIQSLSFANRQTERPSARCDQAPSQGRCYALLRVGFRFMPPDYITRSYLGQFCRFHFKRERRDPFRIALKGCKPQVAI
jgi:hypothetical protein